MDEIRIANKETGSDPVQAVSLYEHSKLNEISTKIKGQIIRMNARAQ
jgi:hypothetical protein